MSLQISRILQVWLSEIVLRIRRYLLRRAGLTENNMNNNAKDIKESFVKALIDLQKDPQNSMKEEEIENLAEWLFSATPKPSNSTIDHRTPPINNHSYAVGAIPVMRTLIPRYREYMFSMTERNNSERDEGSREPEWDPESERLFNYRNTSNQNADGAGSIAGSDPALDKEYPLCACFLGWPPNLFAFTSYFLNGTGVYAAVTNEDNWTRDETLLGLYQKAAIVIANIWLGNYEKPTDPCIDKVLTSENPEQWKQLLERVPMTVAYMWENLINYFQSEGEADWGEIWAKQPNLIPLMMMLHAIVDEVCIGWGIRESLIKTGEQVAKAAGRLLVKHGSMATIHPHRGRVLPKRHTPDAGVTLRSVSAHLAFVRSSVEVKWYASLEDILEDSIDHGKNDTRDSAPQEQAPSKPSEKKSSCPPAADADGSKHPYKGEANGPPHNISTTNLLNILLLPWPLHIGTGEFREILPQKDKQNAHHGSECNQLERRCRYFRYDPRDDQFNILLKTPLRDVLEDANRCVGPIHMAILPEAALTSCEDENTCNGQGHLDMLEDQLSCNVHTRVPLYIAGIRKIKEGKVSNEVCLNILSQGGVFGKRRRTQAKHHAWRLNRSQIQSYQLGGQLHPADEWWEDTPILKRKVTMINIGERLTICPLICEDLARQDPIADLIRAVGPSLVIAILLDGPQLRERWSAQYASVLAEDPGSSVLTLTSLGMIKRYATDRYPSARTSVALWRERNGYARELCLDEKAQALILSLAVDSVTQNTHDGRRGRAPTYTLRFGGLHQLRVRSDTQRQLADLGLL